jgi:hypothetical protein
MGLASCTQAALISQIALPIWGWVDLRALFRSGKKSHQLGLKLQTSWLIGEYTNHYATGFSLKKEKKMQHVNTFKTTRNEWQRMSENGLDTPHHWLLSNAHLSGLFGFIHSELVTTEMDCQSIFKRWCLGQSDKVSLKDNQCNEEIKKRTSYWPASYNFLRNNKYNDSVIFRECLDLTNHWFTIGSNVKTKDHVYL